MNNKELWLFVFLCGILLFNWPFLDIFSLSLPSYLFGFWGLFILIIGFFITMIMKQKIDRNV